MKSVSNKNQNNSEKVKILLLSTYHFANPGRDLIKHNVKDVMDQESQKYLDLLAKKISKFNPSSVLLEYEAKSDEKVNSNDLAYKKNQYRLSYSEIEQIGFRVAKYSDLSQVNGIDEKEVMWKGSQLLDQLEKEPDLKKHFNSAVEYVTVNEKRIHSSLNLQNILKEYNSTKMDEQNKSFYILTNVAGASDNFIGADASASWWHRNFRILANIQSFAKSRRRIFVVAGQGLIAVLKDMLKLDPNVVLEDINIYL